MSAFDFSWLEQSEVGDFTCWRTVRHTFVMDAEEASGAYFALRDSDTSSLSEGSIDTYSGDEDILSTSSDSSGDEEERINVEREKR